MAVFGLNKSQNTVVNEYYVCEELNRVLEINLRESDICNIFPIGKTKKCSIRIKFRSQQQKKLRCMVLIKHIQLDILQK